jgi:predicted Zn-ribbon and HTH transcriptional regulator
MRESLRIETDLQQMANPIIKDLASREAEPIDSDRNKVNRLPYLCQALWELVKEQTDISDESLIAKTREIGLIESVKYGFLKVDPLRCRHCGRNSHPERLTCSYCGHDLNKPYRGVFLDNIF